MGQEALQVRRVMVEGYVQGVGYREFVRGWAVRLGVSGWVRNRADGAVEALLQGAATDLETLLIEMRKGPRGSEVTRLRLLEGGASDPGEPGGFAVRPTL